MSQSLKQKITDRMAELGIQPKRSLGQNFLVSEAVVQKILSAAHPQSFDFVLEIGPGLGSLTDSLSLNSKSFELLELDRSLAEYWRGQGLKVSEGDALKYSWQDRNWQQGSHLLVSNLPYQISSRLVVDFSVMHDSFNCMVLMFQKEVAQRIQAEPGGKEYGLLSVVAQLAWQIDLVLEAGSVDFFPKPNVASRVLKFDRIAEATVDEDFLKFVKASFENRRKKLAPKLTKWSGSSEILGLFQKMGISEDIRAEKLSPQQFMDLYLALKSR